MFESGLEFLNCIKLAMRKALEDENVFIIKFTSNCSGY